MACAPPRRPGWRVGSLTRSPASHTSRSCSRNPARYCLPVLAGIAPPVTVGLVQPYAKASRKTSIAALRPGGRKTLAVFAVIRDRVSAKRGRRRSDSEDMRRVGDVLEPLLAEIDEFGRNRAAHMAPGIGGDANAAGRGKA